MSTNLDANSWHALNLELIAFPVEAVPDQDQDWWRDLTGERGESLRRSTSRVDSGAFRGVAFRLELDLLRIRWAIGKLVAQDAEVLTSAPDIGPYQEAVEWFAPVMGEWLRTSAPPLKRLAFAGKVIRWTGSREESYAVLADCLRDSVKVDPQSREFQYRVNRPRSSAMGIEDFNINRLCTWSAVTLNVTVQATTGSTTRQLERPWDGCLLQLDINTPVDRAIPIPPDRLVAAWEELVSLGNEIAIRGDIP